MITFRNHIVDWDSRYRGLDRLDTDEQRPLHAREHSAGFEQAEDLTIERALSLVLQRVEGT